MPSRSEDKANQILREYQAAFSTLNAGDFIGADWGAKALLLALEKENGVLTNEAVPFFVALRFDRHLDVNTLPDVISGLLYIRGMANIQLGHHARAREFFCAAYEFAFRKLVYRSNPIDISEGIFWPALFHEALSAKMDANLQGLIYARSLFAHHANNHQLLSSTAPFEASMREFKLRVEHELAS
ncbi:hypothetical protein ASD15_15230 [Massilia sp. Root351]|jgi:hypothetical protein|uniref:hypothetical protein n=1 Tax=Massilia sp. Root351 TaxID=1736522 RepID=UPI00070AB500|nr:hypothetical protein [Massilia sp. Root351]KQV80219.1 hypothetical protein ASD15_15230 [Massilia sp. Root351]